MSIMATVAHLLGFFILGQSYVGLFSTTAVETKKKELRCNWGIF